MITPSIARAQQATHHWWFPPAATAMADRVDGLFYLILGITLVMFALVATLLFTAVYRFRADRTDRARYTRGSLGLELLWTSVPALILVVLAVLSQHLWSQMKESPVDDDAALSIEVRPRQFEWDIRYAGGDGLFGTDDDVNLINQMHVPVGRPVVLRLMSQDVIHSFFVPQFRMKQDAVPGLTTTMRFTATRTGSFQIACAELCGLGHYRMRGRLVIESPEAYARWVDAQQRRFARHTIQDSTR